jgi:hypothetical protein
MINWSLYLQMNNEQNNQLEFILNNEGRCPPKTLCKDCICHNFVSIIKSCFDYAKQMQSDSVNNTINISEHNNYSDHYEKYVSLYKCPNCSELEIENDYHYCPKCGIKLDWIE